MEVWQEVRLLLSLSSCIPLACRAAGRMNSSCPSRSQSDKAVCYIDNHDVPPMNVVTVVRARSFRAQGSAHLCLVSQGRLPGGGDFCASSTG